MKNKNKSLKILNLGDNALVGFNLVHLLRDHGISADYLNYYNIDISTKNLPWVYNFKTTPKSFLNKSRIIFESIDICKKYDIIHAHNIFGLPLIFLKKPFFLHIHGSDIRIFAKKNDILGFFLRMIIKRADKIFVATPDLVVEVKKFDREGIFLPNPVDFEKFKPNPSSINFRKKNEIILFHPTRHIRVKRNDILINAFSEVINSGYNVKLIMVNWGELLNESKALVNHLNMNDYVIWVDPIPFYAINDFFNACDIVCDQFEIGNGLGLITLEAMACGKPVITKFLPENFIRGYSTCPPLPAIKTEDDVKRELIILLENEKSRVDCGNNCIRWVKTEHSDMKILSILSTFYKAISDKRV